MADRFYPNAMPDFVAEIPTPSTQQQGAAGSDPLMKLLSMPYASLSQHFKRAALELKETVLSLSLHCDVCSIYSVYPYRALPTKCLCYCLPDCERDVYSDWKTRA